VSHREHSGQLCVVLISSCRTCYSRYIQHTKHLLQCTTKHHSSLPGLSRLLLDYRQLVFVFDLTVAPVQHSTVKRLQKPLLTHDCRLACIGTTPDTWSFVYECKVPLDGRFSPEDTPADIATGMTAMLSGRTWFNREDLNALRVWSHIVAPVSEETALPLTRRERQVLSLIATGFRNPAIAEKLGISLPTVKTHVSALLRKTRSKSRTAMAYRNLPTPGHPLLQNCPTPPAEEARDPSPVPGLCCASSMASECETCPRTGRYCDRSRTQW